MSVLFKRRAVTYQDVWGSDSAEWSDLSGRLTSVEVALGVAAVFSAVDLISSRIAMMDFAEVTRSGQLDHPVPLGPLLSGPSSSFAVDEWMYQASASSLLFGRIVGLVTARTSTNWPSRIEWAHPDQVTVRKVGGRPQWSHQGQPVDTEDVVIRRRSPMIPGDLIGVSPIAKLHVDIQRAVKAAAYERGFFEAGGLPMAVLGNTDSTIDEAQAKAVAARYDEVRRTRGRKPMVMGKGWKVDVLRSSPSESGVDELEARINTKVANVFHVPPEWVAGKTGSALTYNNPEMNQRLLDGVALQPVYTLIERLVSSQLPQSRRLVIYPDSILRSDPKTSAEVDERLIRSGMATPNERRRARGLDDLPDGQGGTALWPPYATSIPKPQGGTQ